MRLWINLALLASFVLAGKLIFNSNKKNFVVFTCVWVRLSGVLTLFCVCVHKKWCEIQYIHRQIYMYIYMRNYLCIQCKMAAMYRVPSLIRRFFVQFTAQSRLDGIPII